MLFAQCGATQRLAARIAHGVGACNPHALHWLQAFVVCGTQKRAYSRRCAERGANTGVQHQRATKHSRRTNRTFCVFPNRIASRCVCWASSRVGASTRPTGEGTPPPPLRATPCSYTICRRGKRKAAVFPLPVLATQIRSLLRLQATGHPCAWIGVGAYAVERGGMGGVQRLRTTCCWVTRAASCPLWGCHGHCHGPTASIHVQPCSNAPLPGPQG